MADYHLNYNFMAPFYALYSANRIEQAEPYEAPLLAAIPRGEWYSEKVTGIPGGIMLPVGEGAFLVSSTLKDGTVGDVTLISEKGRDLKMLNPWEGKEIRIKTPDGTTIKAQGDTIWIPTIPSGTYILKPGK